MEQIADGLIFERKDFTRLPLAASVYDSCKFNSCNFTDCDLSDIKFIDCSFESCDLSMVKLTGTIISGTRFSNCKMLGLQFEDCNEHGFSPVFENCILSHSSFNRRKLKNFVFRKLVLHNADFTGCDLEGSSFDGCDLENATFKTTNLERADLRNAINYSIDPESNNIWKARFTISGVPGLLRKYNIDIDPLN
jgi:fluoroquinolone resistance protein